MSLVRLPPASSFPLNHPQQAMPVARILPQPVRLRQVDGIQVIEKDRELHPQSDHWVSTYEGDFTRKPPKRREPIKPVTRFLTEVRDSSLFFIGGLVLFEYCLLNDERSFLFEKIVVLCRLFPMNVKQNCSVKSWGLGKELRIAVVDPRATRGRFAWSPKYTRQNTALP